MKHPPGPLRDVHLAENQVVCLLPQPETVFLLQSFIVHHLSSQTVFFVKHFRLGEVHFRRLHELCAEPELRHLISIDLVTILNDETYLVCNKIEKEQRHAKIIGEERDSRARLTYWADGDVEFACQNEDNDDKSEPVRPRRQRRFKRQCVRAYTLGFESSAESNLRDEDCPPVDEASDANLVKAVSMTKIHLHL